MPSDFSPVSEASAAQLLASLVARLTPPRDLVQVIVLYAGTDDGLVRQGVAGPHPGGGKPSLWWPDRLSPWSYGATALREQRPLIVPLPHALPQAVALLDARATAVDNLALAIWIPIAGLGVAALFVSEVSAAEALRLAAVVQEMADSEAKESGA